MELRAVVISMGSRMLSVLQTTLLNEQWGNGAVAIEILTGWDNLSTFVYGVCVAAII